MKNDKQFDVFIILSTMWTYRISMSSLTLPTRWILESIGDPFVSLLWQLILQEIEEIIYVTLMLRLRISHIPYTCRPGPVCPGALTWAHSLSRLLPCRAATCLGYHVDCHSRPKRQGRPLGHLPKSKEFVTLSVDDKYMVCMCGYVRGHCIQIWEMYQHWNLWAIRNNKLFIHSKGYMLQ